MKKEIDIEFGRLEISSSSIQCEAQNVEEISEDINQSLLDQPKRAHLTYEQKLWIHKVNQYEGASLNQICQKYDLSISTVNKIIKELKSNVKRAEIYSKIRCKKMILSPKVKIWISEYIKSASWRFTTLDIHKLIQKKLFVSIPRHQIWKYLEQSEKLSYKEGSARPYTLNVNKLKQTNQLFWVKLAQNLYNIKLLINLDESTANNDTKNNYSWLQTGKHWSINNIYFVVR